MSKSSPMSEKGGLTTHVLDTAHGCPAAGVPVRLFAVGADDRATLLVETTTDADGRCVPPLVAPGGLVRGAYRLELDVAAYFRRKGVALPDPPFLDRVTIAFSVAEPGAHYHVPLLVSPYGYSTYRGS